jgi:hypothetical protein
MNVTVWGERKSWGLSHEAAVSTSRANQVSENIFARDFKAYQYNIYLLDEPALD